MPRIILSLPDSLPFQTTLDVLLRDINAAGHLDNAQLVTLIFEASHRFFSFMKIDESKLDGLKVFRNDIEMQYVSEVFEGETLIFNLGVLDLDNHCFDIGCHVHEQISGREVARAIMEFRLINPKGHSDAQIPAHIAEALNRCLAKGLVANQ